MDGINYRWEIDSAFTWEEAQKMAAEGWELVIVNLVRTNDDLEIEREYWFKRKVGA